MHLVTMMTLGGALLILGAAAGHFVFEGPLLVRALLGALVIGVPIVAVVAAITHLLTERAGRIAGGIFHPSTPVTPPRRDYSKEESLIIRGQIDDAVDALRLASDEDPADPRPPFRIAQLLRDETAAYEEAFGWFERAALIPGLADAEQLHILRELVELCRSKLGNPTRAAPLLARVAELQRDTRVGHWALRELRGIKGEMRSDDD
jgi:hypothetical protein